MTIARRQQVCLDVTPYYHCITRCVRRAFLCGFDKDTGRDFEHRRGWVEERLLLLSSVFCIDLAAYAVMSNHYHVVVKIDRTAAQKLTIDQVIERWRVLYKGPDVIQRYLDGETLNSDELKLLGDTVERWRENLSNISRFMGCLNEQIARRANKEDDCKGTFWESRFKSQAILDLPALLRTLCYVDLNPVRAKLAKTPENSQYTSVRRRLCKPSSGLMEFSDLEPSTNSNTLGAKKPQTEAVLPITFKDYLILLDWTGRELRRNKRGHINPQTPDILTRLGYAPEQWMKTQTPQVPWTQKAIGNLEAVKDYCKAVGQKWIWQAI